MLTTADIRKKTPNEEIDYLFLQDSLQAYSQIRDKITTLLKKKELIRVKKGLYIFGEHYAEKPYIKETLANLIYGPSCISLEYALAFYGMIPERVEVITSITPKRDKVFHTPVGTFTYRYLNPFKYPLGITAISLDETHSVLIATPEKALADKIMLASPGLELKNEKEAAEYLYDDLRMDKEKFTILNTKKFNAIAAVYQDTNVDMISLFLEKHHE